MTTLPSTSAGAAQAARGRTQASSAVAVRSSRPVPWRQLLTIQAVVGSIFRYRDLIAQFARRDVESRHKGTMLGVAWTVLNPLFQLGIYTFLFSFVFQTKWRRLGVSPETLPADAAAATHAVSTAAGNFAITFFAGYAIFQIFADCATRAPGLVLDKPNLVQKVVFPLEILPVASLASSLLFGIISFILVIIAKLIATGSVSPTLWQFPLAVLPVCLFALGVGWFLAGFGVFVRDIKHVIVVIMQMVFFMSPIFYPVEQVPKDLQWILNANPFTGIVENARRTLLWGENLDLVSLGISTALGLVLMQLGFAWFMKSKRAFADVM